MSELRIRELNVDMIAPSMAKFRDPDQGGSKIVVIGKPGCFARGTLVRMFGKKESARIENIVVGDVLVGTDGTARRVWDVCRGISLFFSIYATGSNSPIVRVNAEHILTVYDRIRQCMLDIPLMEFLHRPEFTYQSSRYKGRFYATNRYLWMQGQKNIRFYITHDGYLEQYYGVVLRDDHRFLLADGSVVHNTGKTTLITSLLYEKSAIFPTGMIMSGTEDSNGHYKKIFPSTFVYNHLDEQKIEDFVTRQKIAKRHVPNPWAILLLDDCTDEPRVLNRPIFQGLYKNGRHWKMMFILSLQYCMDIRPVIRTNIDGTFILRESNLRNRKTLWENYAGIIPDFGMFCNIMDVITDDYTALYIHNATQSNNIEDCVFWYKAKKVPHDFKFGSRDFWRFHKQRYDSNYKDGFKIY